jgi:dolichol kinase
MGDSDADEDHEEEQSQRRPSAISLGTIRSGLLDSIKTNLFSTNTSATAVEKETWSAIEATSNDNSALAMSNGITKPSTIRLRRNTLPNLDTGSSSHQHIQQYDRKRRGYGKTFLGRSFLSLTQYEAAARKWGYAVYTYAVLVLLILGPVRNLICRYALDSHEPFGWAVGYLFGNVQRVRFLIWEWSLEWWVPLPPLLHATDCASAGITGRAECLRHVVFREANTRLLLCAWCVAIIVVGLGVVLSFTFVEVDTRRKVFHFMMVAMLLPTIFIDPAFISLALVLILAIFLILDLLRASQLPPLSRPIARFLTPYVDGRDLRGPVVVSHIFLLIGCAVPLWLSLAGMRFTGDAPWRQWEVQQRDVSMTAGVVCVGMGDAAASLIGRRFGRRKWPWTGGKSLEGSAAFAFAVTVGLVAAKAWLRIGQWLDQSGGAHDSWGIVMCKAGIAACGASFMEAVLTGGNDNVVVPVVLWLLVKALEV